MRADPAKLVVARSALVPKRDGLTRPVRIVRLEERTYLQALVDTFMHDIDAAMVGRDCVFGYRCLERRGSPRPFGRPLTQWFAFRRRLKEHVASGRFGALLVTDYAAFFDMIEHGRLEGALTGLGAPRDVADELRACLKRLMKGGRGLPQGPDASATLATAFLDRVDRALLAQGFDGYVRYLDDTYIFAADESEARRALRILEQEARELHLLLQSGKTEIIVGPSAIKDHVFEDDDLIAGVDYILRHRPRRAGVKKVHDEWLRASRMKRWPRRRVKYLLRRLAGNRDPVAINWCLRNLGIGDWLANTIGPYLALFSDRPSVQRALHSHLTSPWNLTGFEEANLLRCLLSAKGVDRVILDFARGALADNNREPGSRHWAALLIGKHGASADHALLERFATADEEMARAILVAVQEVEPRLRGRCRAAITRAFPTLKPLETIIRGRPRSRWPTFR
jgi:hypothetical protein